MCVTLTLTQSALTLTQSALCKYPGRVYFEKCEVQIPVQITTKAGEHPAIITSLITSSALYLTYQVSVTCTGSTDHVNPIFSKEMQEGGESCAAQKCRSNLSADDISVH